MTVSATGSKDATMPPNPQEEAPPLEVAPPGVRLEATPEEAHGKLGAQLRRQSATRTAGASLLERIRGAGKSKEHKTPAWPNAPKPAHWGGGRGVPHGARFAMRSGPLLVAGHGQQRPAVSATCTN